MNAKIAKRIAKATEIRTAASNFRNETVAALVAVADEAAAAAFEAATTAPSGKNWTAAARAAEQAANAAHVAVAGYVHPVSQDLADAAVESFSNQAVLEAAEIA